MPKQISMILLLIFLQFFFVFPVLAAQIATPGTESSSNLTLLDCDKCHQKEINDIDEAGLAHKTELSCSDCHTGHRPKSFENIPSCNLCHTGIAHYQLPQCLICHRNPHRPLEIKLPKKAHIECISCHMPQGLELEQNASYHSQLVCTDCHQEHGQRPPCMSCHKGHNDEMLESSCQDCHQPHKPLAVSYADNTPSTDCAGCHPDAFDQLEASNSKHHLLSCATCHRQQHKMVPQCQNCHGRPHADEILQRFPSCGDCHGTAHDLQ